MIDIFFAGGLVQGSVRNIGTYFICSYDSAYKLFIGYFGPGTRHNFLLLVLYFQKRVKNSCRILYHDS
jgi:hypothetical protein